MVFEWLEWVQSETFSPMIIFICSLDTSLELEGYYEMDIN